MTQDVIDISNLLNEEMAANDARERMQVVKQENVLLPCPEPGVYPGVDFLTYARWDAASSHVLAKLAPPSTPAHLKTALDQPPKRTPALIEGEAYHCAILEPDHFERRFVTLGQCEAIKKSDGVRCSNPAIGLYDGIGFCGTHSKGMGAPDASRIVLTPDIFDNARHIRDRVWSHTAARAMLETVSFTDGDAELSLTWIDRQTGVRCKGRLDCVSYPYEGIIDLKSAVSAAKEPFSYAIKRYGYHRQGALYGDGARRVLNPGLFNYFFIAFEKVSPWGVAVYRLDDASLAQGRTELQPLLALYDECKRTDTWPCYSEFVDDIGIADAATAPTSFVEI